MPSFVLQMGEDNGPMMARWWRGPLCLCATATERRGEESRKAEKERRRFSVVPRQGRTID
jgi:hypothetical protein